MDGQIDVVAAAILGAVQGATEFLPVSSDGHLAIAAMILGVSDEMPLTFVMLLHAATLLATVLVLRKDLLRLTTDAGRGLRDPRAFLATDEGRTLAGVIVASVPTAIIGLAVEPHVEELARVPWIIGLGLLGSAAMVLTTLRGAGKSESLSLGRAFIVGVAQGLAVLPGLSRSGSTIAIGMMLGMSGPAAFRFSFLLSLPAISGATLLSLRHADQLNALGVAAPIGAAVAFVTGALALFWLRRLVSEGRLHVFAIYLVPVGIGMLLYGRVG